MMHEVQDAYGVSFQLFIPLLFSVAMSILSLSLLIVLQMDYFMLFFMFL